jgi:predicted RNA binding protein YcfA (HicA-like mRNA interferase family)
VAKVKICLVVGAGSSLANAVYFHGERRQAENPPLDASFFRKLGDLDMRVPPQLRQYARQYPGVDPFSNRIGQPDVGMEEFFRDTFFDFQEASSGDLAEVAYEQLLNLYLRMLRRTTEWIGEDSRTGGPVGRLLARSADLSDELSIITFNHDLILENELSKRARLSRLWCIQQGYGSMSNDLQYTVPGPASSRPSSRFFEDHSAACDHRIHILKLHGSLNWYVSMPGKRPSRKMLEGTSKAPKIRCTQRRFETAELRFNVRTRTGSHRFFYTWPVIVPPVHGKEGIIRSLLPKVWRDAEEALKTADRVAFVGYSLPALDIHAERMIRRSVAANVNVERIDIANPSPESASRFASVCSPNSVGWHSSIEGLTASWA